MKAMIHTELRTEPAEVRAGRPVALLFTPRDEEAAAIRDLQIVHEKAAHLLIVSEDLSRFEHLHPQRQSDGSLWVTHAFPLGGNYRLYLDFAPAGMEPVVERFSLNVRGTTYPPAELSEESARIRAVETDGLRITMSTDDPLVPGEETMLHFTVVDAQTDWPVTDLEPYLGAMAHFVIISQDGEEFLHAHPMDTGRMPARHGHPEHGGHGGTSAGHPAGLTGSAEVVGHTVFPRPGLYKIWAQFQRRGRVITASFVVRVGE